jgi:hypothetical protein
MLGCLEICGFALSFTTMKDKILTFGLDSSNIAGNNLVGGRCH